MRLDLDVAAVVSRIARHACVAPVSALAPCFFQADLLPAAGNTRSQPEAALPQSRLPPLPLPAALGGSATQSRCALPPPPLPPARLLLTTLLTVRLCLAAAANSNLTLITLRREAAAEGLPSLERARPVSAAGRRQRGSSLLCSCSWLHLSRSTRRRRMRKFRTRATSWSKNTRRACSTDGASPSFAHSPLLRCAADARGWLRGDRACVRPDYRPGAPEVSLCRPALTPLRRRS